jgi:hypothetical protein
MIRRRILQVVQDGRIRAHRASIDQIRLQVRLEFADRLATASWFKRLVLRREMRREIERRLERVAPPWGLYFSAHK